jgi:hypothetical protein
MSDKTTTYAFHRITLLGCGVTFLIMATMVQAAQIIEFTQVPCQFLESEGGINRGYASRSIKDCEAINEKTSRQRLAEARPLVLKPGKYVFHVANRNVPYELGFWLRGATAVTRITLPGVSGGGIMPGGARDYEINLEPGNYVYSCPLNNTPDYKLAVR